MVNYGVPVWQLVLEAAQGLKTPFAPIDIINEVKKKNPNVNSNTIRCHLFGMTSNHPSSKYYPSIRKNHPAFNYLGAGQFELLDKKPPNAPPDIPQWEKIAEKISELQFYICPFKVEFLDRDAFKKFCDNLNSNLMNLKEICLTGYFSETIRAELEIIAQNTYYHVRLISPDFPIGTPRDKKNLEALRKLSKAGVEVKFNNRIHARLLVARTQISGLLILGSFDFNTECIGKERYDAGIKTSHPDLIKSAINFFEQVWNDSETQSLDQFLKG